MSRWVEDIIKLTVRKARMCRCILVWLWIFGREKKLNAELSTWKEEQQGCKFIGEIVLEKIQ